MAAENHNITQKADYNIEEENNEEQLMKEAEEMYNQASQDSDENDEMFGMNDVEEEGVINFPLIGKGKYIEAVGRRKTATCRVRIFDQTKKTEDFEIVVNNRKYTDYFQSLELVKIVDSSLRKLRAYAYKVSVLVKGGGLRGQAEAIRLGLARALVKLNPEWRSRFKRSGYLIRDPRAVERKKYGRRKARKREQWHKR